MAINYGIKKLNSGSDQFLSNIFGLYNLGLQKKLWIEKEIMSAATFTNILTVARKLLKYEWSKSFIEDYSFYLDPTIREDYVNFNKARILYEQGEYEYAHELLIQSDFKDIFMSISTKVLLARIYFIQKSYIVLQSHLDNIMVFLNRKKMLAYHKNIYRNIVSALRKLIQLFSDPEPNYTGFKEYVNTLQLSTEKEWMLQQIKIHQSNRKSHQI